MLFWGWRIGVRPGTNQVSINRTFGALVLLPRTIWLPIAAIAILIGCVFWANEKSVESIQQQDNRMAALLTLQTRVLELRNAVVDAEAGQRGYLLTGNASYLEPYRASVDSLVKIVAAVRAGSLSSPEVTSVLSDLERLQSRKLAEMSATITLASHGDRPDALAIVRGNDGQRVMNEFRVATDRTMALISTRIEEARQAQSRSADVSRYGVLAMATLAIAMLLLVLRLFMNQALRQAEARAAAEQHRNELQALVDERTQELFELSSYLQSVQEREKAELARNLHDELGGLLTAAKMDLAWLQGKSTAESPETLAKLGHIGRFLESAMDLKRRVIEDLRPTLLDHFGLATAISAHYEEICAKAGLQCAASVSSDLGDIPTDVSLVLFRVAQEALTNIVRHARARTVRIRLAGDSASYQLTISDDGAGFDMTRKAGSHGLAGMKHRVQALRGTLAVTSAPGQGTSIHLRIPRARLPTAAA
jgi:signal transduction histidine kinase